MAVKTAASPGEAEISRSRPRTAVAGSLLLWAALLAMGWALFNFILMPGTIRIDPAVVPYKVERALDLLRGILPGKWVDAPMRVVWARALTMAIYFVLVTGIWLAYRMAVRTAAREHAPGGSDENRPPFTATAAHEMGLSPSATGHPLLAVLAGTLLFCVLALFWYGLFSSDVYAYAEQGKMQVVYHLNPLRDLPLLMRGDPLVQLSPWQQIPSTYGPAWQMIAALVAAVVEWLGGKIAYYLLAFKLVNVTLVLASTALVWAIGGELGWAQSRRRAAAILFGWCPLVVIDLAGNPHNDAWLVLLVLLAIWLHLRGAWPLAVGALMLAGLVKLSAYFLLPGYGMLLLRTSRSRQEGVRRTAVGFAIIIGLAVLTYLPYASALPNAITSPPLTGAYGPSIGLMVRQALADFQMAVRGALTPAGLTASQATGAVTMPIWYGALIVWGLLAVGLSLRVRDFASLLRAWALILFLYLCIGSVWFMPWYVTWLLPIVALLPPGVLRRAILLMAWGATLFYVLTPSLPGDPTPNLRNYYVPAVIFFPPLLYLAWVGISRLRTRTLAARPAEIG